VPKPLAALVGAGETAMGKLPGRSSLQLHADAARAAVADAGLRLTDIDGIITVGSRAEPYLMHSVAVAEALGIRPRLAASMELGGAVHAAGVLHAARAVAAGQARYVLVVAADNANTGMAEGLTETLARSGPLHPSFEYTAAPTVPALFALAAQRHMAEYGTRPEHLAAAAVAMRQHAMRHPGAHMRKPLTLAEAMVARPVALPLRLFDCAPVSDGGGAVVVGPAESAGSHPHRAAYILGGGEYHGYHHLSLAESLNTTGASESGRQALARAGLTVADIHLALLYDCFTITLILMLEDLGFCPKGEGGPFVASGAISPGGRLPVNTHGGLLSHGHPGRPGGINHLVEAVRQLQGMAGERQVPGCQTALVHLMGGVLATHATLVLGTEATL
jgi:acetyl-CoA acetyltransferase